MLMLEVNTHPMPTLSIGATPSWGIAKAQPSRAASGGENWEHGPLPLPSSGRAPRKMDLCCGTPVAAQSPPQPNKPSMSTKPDEQTRERISP